VRYEWHEDKVLRFSSQELFAHLVSGSVQQVVGLEPSLDRSRLDAMRPLRDIAAFTY
jgi:hypothetical protein